jgi:hypothetical protein
MTTVSATIHIDAPTERVWEIVADLGAVATFHPYVTHSYYSSQSKAGPGARRVCKLGPKIAVEETAVDWRAGEAYTLSVAFVKGQTPPIRDFQATVAVQPDGTRTRASIVATYQPKFGLFGWLLDQLMIKRKYSTMLPNVLAGLKHYAETGEVVDGSFLKRPEIAGVRA